MGVVGKHQTHQRQVPVLSQTTLEAGGRPFVIIISNINYNNGLRRLSFSHVTERSAGAANGRLAEARYSLRFNVVCLLG
jgi:hypothetical protein